MSHSENAFYITMTIGMSIIELGWSAVNSIYSKFALDETRRDVMRSD
jgi:hypothetical protein